MKYEEKTECYCACHFGGKVRHWQLTHTKYELTVCSCEIEGNPNFVEEEVRKEW